MKRVLKVVLVLIAIFSQSGCTHLFYQPDRYLYYSPEKLGFHPREIQFKSADGTRLLGWFFPARTPKPKGTVVQFHGNAENMSSHFTSLVWLIDEGYNLFTFDYRGYGGSGGEPTQAGIYLDGMAALDKAWELRTGLKFIVYGQSLGGAILMRAFEDFRNKSQTSLIVLDSTFMNYKTVARRLLSRTWFTWPLSFLPYLFVSNKYGSEQAVSASQNQILIIHDKKDPAVPFACGEDIFEKAQNASHKEFWKLDDGHHIEVFSEYNMSYRKNFIKLLENLSG